MKVKLTKISDNKFDGNHPNGINVNYTKSGDLLYAPEISKPVYIMDGWRSLKTSLVTEILSWENDLVTKFKTENSTYTIKYL